MIFATEVECRCVYITFTVCYFFYREKEQEREEQLMEDKKRKKEDKKKKEATQKVSWAFRSVFIFAGHP